MNAFNGLLRELSGEVPQFPKDACRKFNESLQKVTLAAVSFHMLG